MSYRQAEPMRFLEIESDTGGSPCYVCCSHAGNQDDYIYKTWKGPEGGKVKEALHRFILRAHHGLTEWPEGYECDHICGRRRCAAPHHLRLIERSDHKRITNAARYADRNEQARLHWLATGCTGTALAEKFGVSFGQGCRWIRDWKAEALAA